MNYIEELIGKECPHGVEHIALGELGKFYGGLSGKSKDDFEDGNAKYITYMNVYTNMRTVLDTGDYVKVGEGEKQNSIQLGDILFTGSSETPDDCGMSSVVTCEPEEKIYLNSFCFGFRLNNPQLLLPEFSKYIFRSDAVRKQIQKAANGVTRFNVSKKKMEYVKIPIPPLTVQEEIVKILDTFVELSETLNQELIERNKQFEFYKNLLTTFEEK